MLVKQTEGGKHIVDCQTISSLAYLTCSGLIHQLMIHMLNAGFGQRLWRQQRYDSWPVTMGSKEGWSASRPRSIKSLLSRRLRCCRTVLCQGHFSRYRIPQLRNLALSQSDESHVIIHMTLQSHASLLRYIIQVYMVTAQSAATVSLLFSRSQGRPQKMCCNDARCV